jgi:membrane-associated protease RseP (regulator of RpoE activity)
MTLTAKEPGTSPPLDDAGTPPTGPPPAWGPPFVSPRQQLLRLLVGLVLITGIFLVAGLGYLLLFILIVVLIVMLHELAHFVTAKLSGMKVTEFFVGFGPRLWSVRRGETEYGIKAIPAGGYVKITGFTMLDEVSEEDEPRTYRQQPFWKRIIVASAGSAMHFLIALVLALIVAFGWGAPGNNQEVVAVDHWVGVAQTPAQAAGIKVGDVIVSYNGHGFSGPNTLTNELKKAPAGVPVTLGIERDGQVVNVRVTPRNGKGVHVVGEPGKAGRLANRSYIGIAPEPANQSLGFLSAVNNGLDQVGQATKLEVQGIGRLFSASGLTSYYHQVTNSKVAAKAATNPTNVRPVSLVGIANLGVKSEQAGPFWLFQLLIEINVIFGMLNMLPMIPFDGGHVAIAAYEWIRTKKGKPFYRADITKLFPVVAVLVGLLVILTASALYLDIAHPI